MISPTVIKMPHFFVLFPNAPVFAAGALRGAVQVMQMTTVQFEGVYLNLLKMHRFQNEGVTTTFQES